MFFINRHNAYIYVRQQFDILLKINANFVL